MIRPLLHEDLPTVASLYAEMCNRDPALPAPGFEEFFERALLRSPLADSEVPTLVFDDPEDGVVGMIGSHPRRYRFGERDVLAACSGPLIVRPAHRPRGLGALLLRRYLAGPQDLTFNDRLVDEAHLIWQRLGGITDTATSIGWKRVLAPLGTYANAATRRGLGRRTPPGAAALAQADAAFARRSRPQPPTAGTSEELRPEDLIALYESQRKKFPLRPAFEPELVAALFDRLAEVDLGGEPVGRLVRDEKGAPVGAFVMIAGRHGAAHVLEVFCRFEHAGLALDHLFHVAAEQGAVKVSGRVESHLLGALRSRRCRFAPDVWTMVQTKDVELRDAVLSGRGLLSRLAGEWWMRPHAEVPA